MSLKVKFIILFVLLIALVSTVNETYARYSSEATGTSTLDIATWKVKLNDTDITSSSSNTITLTPNFYSNGNVADGKIAPGAYAYIDIVVDVSDVETAYTVDTYGNINSTNSDFVFEGYNWNYGQQWLYDIPEEDRVDSYYETGSYDNSTTIDNVGTYVFRPYATGYEYTKYWTLRIWLYWNDDADTETLDDDADTSIGLAAANGTYTMPTVTLTLTFNQAIS